MKKAGKYILWIIGTILWFFFLILFRAMDTEYQSHTHQIILIITGILLTIYIWKRMSSETDTLRKENQQLKAENQKLRQELAGQVVQRVINKSEQKKSGEEEK